jgi:hypothetical protein
VSRQTEAEVPGLLISDATRVVPRNSTGLSSDRAATDGPAAELESTVRAQE